MAEDASNAGIRFIEHLGPGLKLLASCATNEDEIRAELAAVKGPKLPSAKLPFVDELFAKILARIVVNPQLMTPAETVSIMRKALDSYSDERRGPGGPARGERNVAAPHAHSGEDERAW